MSHDEAYNQAEQKIQQALKSGATELDLRNPDDSHLAGDCHLTPTKGGHHGA
jgi:hypothetical protein